MTSPSPPCQGGDKGEVVYRLTSIVILYTLLHRKDFHFRANHIDEMHLLNEVDHFVQTGVDMSAIIAYRADTNLCPLPKVIISDL